jgi:O-antigen ligase
MPMTPSPAVAVDGVGVTSSTRAAPGTGRILHSAFGVAGICVFFTGADRYAFAFWSGPAPIQLVVLFAGAAAALVILNVRAPLPLLRSALLAWVLLFALMTTAWAIVTPSSPAATEAMRERYRAAGFLVAFAVFFDDPRARKVGTLAVAAAVVFASCLNVAELFGLVRFVGQEDVRVGGRAAGLYVNANDAAMAIVFGLAIAISRLPRTWRVPLLVVGAAGVAPTFSRGAALCLVALIAFTVWRKQIGLWPVALACAAVVLFVTANADDVARLLDDLLTADTRARLHFGGGDSDRLGLARGAWQMFADSPLVGHGLGAMTQSQGQHAHNQFLLLAGDYGVLGLLAFPALALALVTTHPLAAPFALVLMLAGLFSHNLLEHHDVLLAIALAAMGDALPLGEGPRAAVPPAGEQG